MAEPTTYPTTLQVPVAFVNPVHFEKYLKHQNFKWERVRVKILESAGAATCPCYRIQINKPMDAFWIGANSGPVKG